MAFRDVIELPTKAEIRSKGKRSTTGRKLLIYFIPGNPGVVEYYRSYVERVHEIIRDDKKIRDDVVVYAESHDGFELQPGSRPANLRHMGPYSLAEEVESVKVKLQKKVRNLIRDEREPLDVILVGHSVGAYMLLDTIAWWQDAHEEQKLINIIGGVCLFPTVVDIAKSKKGKMEGLAMRTIPFIDLFIATLTRLASLLPHWNLNAAKFFNPGPTGWEITAAILSRWRMTRQMVYLARDEMRKIKVNKWHPHKLWGKPEKTCTSGSSSAEAVTAAKPEVVRTKLFFYWGDNDYWVAKETRDELLMLRRDEAKEETRHQPTMLVDPNFIPHTFSLDGRHADIVAKQTVEWIEGLLTEQRRDSAV